MAYMYLSVAFIQMLKASQILIMLLFSFIAGIIEPSWTLFVITTFIVCGICATIAGEVNFNVIGVVIQSTAIVAEGSRLILVNLLLSSKGIRLRPLQALFYFAPACAFCLLIYWIAIEAWRMPWDDITDTGALVLVTNGLMSFVLNCASVLLISHANAMILSLSGVVKDILIVAGSCIVFGTIVTTMQYVGYSIALSGVFAYKIYTTETLRLAFVDLIFSRCLRSDRNQSKNSSGGSKAKIKSIDDDDDEDDPEDVRPLIDNENEQISTSEATTATHTSDLNGNNADNSRDPLLVKKRGRFADKE
eukprot:CAMPEP_0197538350 /NCGR_PEP_ID=MMETSP1318-20131121/59573_1 /TAXON_ID=552666 /ORGANISM="Partenskyella glossopodia, Strain RCC365" /LENGTH=304 /DNA_ID=CAMNT_0043096745 /DNA_START=272 /DNA_END=1183 /DNA_ORIENTATION=+